MDTKKLAFEEKIKMKENPGLSDSEESFYFSIGFLQKKGESQISFH